MANRSFKKVGLKHYSYLKSSHATEVLKWDEIFLNARLS